ncbi:unnamed protein product [Sphagnum compactum]
MAFNVAKGSTTPATKADRKALLDVGAWLFNVTTSVGIIMVNKQLMANYDFRFATTLTGLHFVMTTLMTVGLRCMGYIQPSHLPFLDLVKFALCANFSIVGMNVSLMWNSVGFYQIAKLSMIPVSCLFEVLFDSIGYSRDTKLSIMVVLVGVAICTVSDVSVNAKGFVAAVVAVWSTALQQYYVHNLQKKYSLGSFDLLGHTAPVQAASLIIAGPFIDYWLSDLRVDHYAYTYTAVFFIILSCLIAVGVNLSQFICIGRFSAVSFQVLGHMKTVLVLILGFFLFGRQGLSVQVVLGMLLAVCGMIWYGNASSKPGGKEKRVYTLVSDKRTEERLRILLSDKASLDLKFKEELEQGNNDRKRLQHLLEVEKAKLEASEKVLKDVGLNCVMFLNKAAHDPKQNDVLEKNRITAVPVAMEHHETQGISTVELEKQPRIEENESIFNNSTETAEENPSHHFKNAVEKRVHVQLEMEKCKHRTSYTSSQDARKMMSDSLVIGNSEPRTGSLKKFASLSLQPEFFKGWDDMVPVAVANDSKSRTEIVNDTSSARSDESCKAMTIDMDIVPLRVDSQNHVTESIIQLQSEKFQQWVEDEEAARLSLLPLSQRHQNLDQFHPQDGFSLGGAALEAPENRNVDMKPVTIMVTNGFMSRSESDEMIIRPPVDVTEDRRALSLSMESSAQGKELFRVSQSHLDDSEMGHSENAPCFSWQTRDVLYPLSVQLNSATGPDQELIVLKSKEHMESTRCLHGGAGRNGGHLDLYNSLHTSEDNTSDHCEEIFPGDEEAKEDEKLKKAKAKLHILVHEQDMVWRMAEDTLENMNQRLKRLEAHKVRLQETTISDDYPSGFTSFYKSPAYEESKEASEVDCSHVTRGQLPLMILPGNSDESQVTVREDNISASSEKHDDLQKDRGQQKSVHSPQKSSSCFLAGGASPGSGKQAISFEAPSDLFDDQIDDHDDSWSWLYTDHPDWKDILAVADETTAEDEMTFDIQQTVEKLLSSLVETDHPHMLISGSPIAKPGGMRILKNIVHKLTCVLHEQQNKLATFKVIAGKKVDNEPHILDLCDIYHELLKEMSCELGSFHHELRFGISKETWVGQESLMSDSKEKENLELQVDEAEHRLNLLLHQKLGADGNNAMKSVKEHESQIQRKEKSFKYAKELNQQLVENMSKVEAMLAELRCHNKDLLAPLESRLNDTQHDVESLEDTCNKLQKELEVSQLRATKLEEALHVKETEIQDTTQKMAVIQHETDAITLEKLEFLTMIQGLRHEAEQQQKHLLEVMNINQELLEFSEKKENEVTQLNKQVANLQQNLLLERPHDLLLERAQVTPSEALNEMKDVCEEGETIQLHNKLLQSKLEETEYELAAREEALENLTQHLALTIEGQDSILQEKEQLQLSLNNAHYKEYRMDDQVRKSKTIIEELEVKLASMEGEVTKVRTEAMEMHKKTHEFCVVQREAKEMRKRVLELEEEIMEKEGQICILKSSLQSMYEPF